MINNETKLLTKSEAITVNRVDVSPKIKLKDAVPQIAASCAINLLVIHVGVNMAFSSILIPQLAEAESDIKIDLDSSSNIASIVTISVALGALVCGYLMDRFGRMRLSKMICVPFAVAWLLIALSRNLYMIYTARVLSGFCGGVYGPLGRVCKLLIVIKNRFRRFSPRRQPLGLTTVALVYVSEIASAEYRGMLLCLNSVAVSLGILMTYLLNIYFKWRTIGFIYVALSVVTCNRA